MKKSKTIGFERCFWQVKGVKTAIYSVGNDASKPLVLLVHGYSGNYFGLSFLTRELLGQWRVVLAELPSHGASEIVTMDQLTQIHAWYRQLVENVEAEFGEISLVVGHSYGCYVVAESAISRRIPTVLMNPLFKPTEIYLKMAKLSINSRLMNLVQNFWLISPFKALVLWKHRSLPALKNVLQDSVHAQGGYKRGCAQGQMLNVIFEKELFRPEKSCFRLVILGELDDFNQEFEDWEVVESFGQAKIATLPGGHLMPIELPRSVAEVINREILG